MRHDLYRDLRITYYSYFKLYHHDSDWFGHTIGRYHYTYSNSM
jgi:hypothetical protein